MNRRGRHSDSLEEPDFVRGLKEQWFDEDNPSDRKIIGRLFELEVVKNSDSDGWDIKGEIRLLDGKIIKGIIYKGLDQETATLFAQTRGGTPVYSGSEAYRRLQNPSKPTSVSMETKEEDKPKQIVVKPVFDVPKPKFRVQS